jgi:hypothetical protein
MPADKPRNTSFLVHGHQWKAQPDDSFSRIIPIQGALGVGTVLNIELEKGASEKAGDYLYRSGSLKWDLESGMWGIFRIMKHHFTSFFNDIYEKLHFGVKKKH